MYRGMEKAPLCTIVIGPPGSGKTTYVKERIKRGEIVVDLDKIYEALTFLPHHDKPQELLGLMLESRGAILGQIAMMGERRPRLWIIASAPKRSDREIYRKMFGKIQVIALEISPEKCMSRISSDPTRALAQRGFARIVSDWWSDYEPEAGSVARPQSDSDLSV